MSVGSEGLVFGFGNQGRGFLGAITIFANAGRAVTLRALAPHQTSFSGIVQSDHILRLVLGCRYQGVGSMFQGNVFEL